MPAIQAMRSDALAARAKEDVQEKIPSFFNSVSQALGQSVMSGQDAAEQLVESRLQAANQIAAQLRNKTDAQGSLAEMTVGAGMKLISSFLSTIMMALQKTTTTDAIQVASDIANFLIERKTLQLQWDAAAATYAQWTVQAGYTGHDAGNYFFPNSTPAAPASVTQTFAVPQWLNLGVVGGAPASGTVQNGNFLNGRGYVGMNQTPTQQQAAPTGSMPSDIQPYKILQLINPDADDPADYEYQEVGLTVIMDATDGSSSDDGAPGQGDVPSAVYYSPSTGRFYIAYQLVYTATGAPGTTSIPPLASGTVNTIAGYGAQPPDYPGYDIQFSNVNITTLASQNTNNPQTLTAAQASIVTRAMGARGAIKYRDALTPRFTDRTSYSGSDLGAGGYENYYTWGSVGSITRVGQY